MYSNNSLVPTLVMSLSYFALDSGAAQLNRSSA